MASLRLLIIGYGNRLRRDDGVGIRAAELLRERLVNADVEILGVAQLTPELTEAVSRAQQVIFIDAAVDGAAGQIRRREIAPSAAGSRFTHQMTPEALLAGAAALYGASPPGVLYSISGESFEYGESLTSAVERAVEELVSTVSVS
jgi:hydrogenase maturation protease